MDQFSRLRNELCDNLKLLSFEEFVTKRKETFELKPDLLKKLSQYEFQTITYFLFKTLNSEECKQRFKACYPVLDRKQESEFRQITLKWLQEITDKEMDCHLPRIVPIYFHFQYISGEAFCHLYLEFTNYVIIKVVNRIASSESIEYNLNDSNDIELIENETKDHFNEYQKTKLEIENETQKWINQMQYFIDTKHQLLESIEASDQKRTQVLKSKFSQQIKSNEELVQYFNQLQTDVQELRNTLIPLNNTVIKNWKTYSNPLESQTNSPLYSSTDLNNSINDLNSSDCVVENLVFRMQTYDTLLEKAQNCGNDLVAFVEVSSTLPNEVKAYRNQLIGVINKFNSMFNQFKCSVENKRSQLLKNPVIIERRKWFVERVPDLMRINFKFEPKKRESNGKDSVTSLTCDSKETSPLDESPISKLDSIQSNYSFKVMDFSTYGYIPPSGLMDDSRLFSPIERTKLFDEHNSK